MIQMFYFIDDIVCMSESFTDDKVIQVYQFSDGETLTK